VAKMAGMPPSLVERAEELLSQLEKQHLGTSANPSNTNANPSNTSANSPNTSVESGKSARGRSKPGENPQFQLSIFDAHSETFSDIRNLLNALDIDRLTPVEALLKINEIKNLLK
jgi:DNA mismatch repair protein MutS